MTYMVSIYNSDPGFTWQVADETGLVIDSGLEDQWTEALSQATLVVTVNLGNHYGAPDSIFLNPNGQGE